MKRNQGSSVLKVLQDRRTATRWPSRALVRWRARAGPGAVWRTVLVLAALGWASPGAAATTPCRLPGVEHEARCGVVPRPLDPEQPRGVRIDVHYAVLPALARNKKPDPVLVFAGGPGQSAIGLAPSFGTLLARVLNRRDVVLIDQRGTGRSAPLPCEPDDPWAPLAQAFDARRPVERLRTCLAALRALPHGDLRQYTTSIAAADVEAVRAQLGAERVNLVGVSYGTRVALEYQRQFPQRVRRTVLDGVVPPDMVLPASFARDNQAALDAVFEACERTPTCAQRHPMLRARWRAFVASLPHDATIAHPLSGRSERVHVGADALAQLLRGPLYVPAWAGALPAAMDAAIDGRFEPLVGLASAFSGARPRPGQALAQGMHFSVVCSEDEPRLATATDVPGADFATSFAALYREVCAAWPRGHVPAAFYTLPLARTPVLLLSGGIDPATPPRHGARVAQALGARARHVVVPHAGHGVLGIGCMRDVLFRVIDLDDEAQALAVDAACATSIPRPPMVEAPGTPR